MDNVRELQLNTELTKNGLLLLKRSLSELKYSLDDVHQNSGYVHGGQVALLGKNKPGNLKTQQLIPLIKNSVELIKFFLQYFKNNF